MLERAQMALTVLCGAFLVLTFVATVPGIGLGDHHVYAFIAVGLGSVFALRSAAESFRSRTLDVNILMVLAAVGAVAVGHFEDAAVLLFLFSLSSSLEAMAMTKTQSAIEALVRLRPSSAILVKGESDAQVPVEDLQVGDMVRVLPFENIPTDGELATENASVNEATVTGESMPVAKTLGEPVLAGTQNLDHMMLMRVTQRVADSSLEKIVSLVRESQENKASGERLSVWFGARYTLFVLSAFALSLAVRLAMGQTWDATLMSSLILLVALSPCALVISSPAAALSALAFAARRGILVRGGQYMEESGRITMVALDKTGTLTQGRPQIVEVCVGKALAVVGGPACGTGCAQCDCISCWHNGEALTPDAQVALRLAASAEVFSTHPIAESIVAYARGLGIEIPEVTEQTVVPGQGVEAVVEGRRVRVGQATFFPENLPGGFRDHVSEMRERGMTAVLVHDGETWAAIGLRDQARPEAPALIKGLRDAGVRRLAMLTGDNEVTGRAIAEELGIDEVYAGLQPEDKKRLLTEWVAKGERVMMVGDGVNDAPALAAAHVGVAMGGLGSEGALRAADVVLVQDRVALIPTLVRLGRKTNGIIRANLLFAAGMIIFLLIGSFFGKVPLPLAVIGHEGSTALVVLNGLRLLRGPGR